MDSSVAVGAAFSNGSGQPSSASTSSGEAAQSVVPSRIENNPEGAANDDRSELDITEAEQVEDEIAEPLSRFLLVCVNTRPLTELLQLDLTNINNDHFLFDQIRRHYWEARRQSSWNYGHLTPRWLGQRLPARITEWLATLHLRVPHMASLIKVSSCVYLTEMWFNGSVVSTSSVSGEHLSPTD